MRRRRRSDRARRLRGGSTNVGASTWHCATTAHYSYPPPRAIPQLENALAAAITSRDCFCWRKIVQLRVHSNEPCPGRSCDTRFGDGEAGEFPGGGVPAASAAVVIWARFASEGWAPGFRSGGRSVGFYRAGPSRGAARRLCPAGQRKTRVNREGLSTGSFHNVNRVAWRHRPL